MLKHSRPPFDLSPKFTAILIFISILVWVFIFRHYLTGQFILTGDAVPYFEHVKFFIDQISQGQYPMWDPSRETGVPNDFFLRRIGQLNPLFLVIIPLQYLSPSYIQAYLIFLALYFVLGLLGYFFLLKNLFKNSVTAYAGFCLLLFSSFTSILFKSFLVYLFTPMIWFAYFMVKFNESPEKKYFIGIICTLMIIFNTYLPFYFLTILTVMLLSALIVYPKELKNTSVRFAGFMRQNKILFFIALIALGISIYPGIVLFQELNRGELILPARQAEISGNSLAVAEQTLAVGGTVLSDLSHIIFPKAEEFVLGWFYLPFFGFIFLLFSVVTKASRFVFFITISMVMFVLLTLYDATPVYPFLFKHIFYFKYFRNFQFILWIVLFPMLTLMCADQFNRLMEKMLRSGNERKVFLAGLLTLTVLQSVFIFHQADKRVERNKIPYPYRYAEPGYVAMKLPEKDSRRFHLSEELKENGIQRFPVTAYLCTKYSYRLRNFNAPDVLDQYWVSKFIVYQAGKDASQPLKPSDAQFITKENHNFRILDFNVNSVRIKTDFRDNKFLVFNDTYYSGWHAFVDHREVPIHRSNVAFKGVAVPAGEHEIVFQYRTAGEYIWVYIMHAVFIAMFGYMMILFVTSPQMNKRSLN